MRNPWVVACWELQVLPRRPGLAGVVSFGIAGLSQATSLSLNVHSREVLPVNTMPWAGCSAASQCWWRGGWVWVARGREWLEKDGQIGSWCFMSPYQSSLSATVARKGMSFLTAGWKTPFKIRCSWSAYFWWWLAHWSWAIRHCISATASHMLAWLVRLFYKAFGRARWAVVQGEPYLSLQIMLSLLTAENNQIFKEGWIKALQRTINLMHWQFADQFSALGSLTWQV